MSKVSRQCETSYLYEPFLFGAGVKHNVHTNKPTKTTNSFDETATATAVNLGIDSFQTESKADEHSRESGGRTQG